MFPFKSDNSVFYPHNPSSFVAAVHMLTVPGLFGGDFQGYLVEIVILGGRFS